MEEEKILLKIVYKKAYYCYLEASYDESIKILNNSLDIWFETRDKYKFMTLIGLNYLKLKNYDRAERAFYEVLGEFPYNPKILDLIGTLYYESSKFVESEKMYLKARDEDFFNFGLTLKSAYSAWKSGNIIRAFKRLKAGYIPSVINAQEEKELKKFLLDFLRQSKSPQAFDLVKNFREWQLNKKKASNPYDFKFKKGKLWQRNI